MYTLAFMNHRVYSEHWDLKTYSFLSLLCVMHKNDHRNREERGTREGQLGGSRHDS
jgi:hypothetical protein